MLKEMMQTDATDPFLPYALALEYKKLGQTMVCAEQLNNLLGKFPDYLPAYYQLGQTLEETGNTQAAVLIYKKGLALARQQKDMKTAGEINEALQRLESD